MVIWFPMAKFLKVYCSLLLSGGLAASAAAPAQVLQVALGETKAPYVQAEQNSGVEVELVTALLQDAGYTVRMQYMPNRRAVSLLETGLLDAAISPRGPFLSEPYIAYQNMALTLCRRHLRLNTLADLEGHSIAAFQNASQFLGAEFSAQAAHNPNYREPGQASINRLLYAGAVEVGVADINIFLSINRQFGLGQAANEELCPYPLFPPTLYRLAFRDQAVRDSFNRALRRALRGQLYETLGRRYQLPLEHGHPYFKPPMQGRD